MSKYSVIICNVDNFRDRYMMSGYGRDYDLDTLFDRVASVKNVTGVELIGGAHVTSKNAAKVKANLERTGLKLSSIIPDNFGRKEYGKGAFSSKKADIRRQAIQETEEMMDIAQYLGGDLINLWPGQDGYDYPFQGDYIEERNWFVDGIRECCKHRKDTRISIEYKIKEPRNFSYPANVTSALLMVQEIGMDNCGITIDFGHGAVAYENPAESVAILKKYGNKLYHVHMNDNYGFWDDDMMTGSVHTISSVEFFYWLKRTGYKGYISTDQFSYREDGRDAVNESIRWFEVFDELADRIDEAKLTDIYASGNACEISAYMRKLLFDR